MPGDFLLDGECVGEVFHAFDLLERAGQNLRARPYEERYVGLLELLSRRDKHPALASVATAWTPEEKRSLYARLQAAHKEGIVFKRFDAPYTPGRPAIAGAPNSSTSSTPRPRRS